MDEKVMITCPYHQQKKFFRCKECKDIEVECEYCKCKWLVTIWADANGFKADYKKATKIA